MNKLRKSFPHGFKNMLNRIPSQFAIEKKHRTAAIYAILGILCVSLGYGMGFLVALHEGADESKWENSIDSYYDPVDIVLKKEVVTIVDIRSSEVFAEGHIRNAVNIPVTIQNREILNEAEIIAQVSQLNSKTPIVIYGENNYSSDPWIAAELFDTLNYPVRVLRVGWNEFSHFTSFWLPERLSNEINIIDFIVLPGLNEP